MKIAITKKVNISLTRRAILPFFFVTILAIGALLVFFGYDMYQKNGTPNVTGQKKPVSVDKKKLDSTNEYKDFSTRIDTSSGIGKSDPFRP